MNIKDYLDTDKLEKYVNKGYVTARTHNTLPLTIYCYGRKAVYDNLWDDVTTRTRGLIVDNNTGEIVARPFEKFFNYDTPGRSETYPRSVENIDKEFGPPVITEKVNGCLGILYRHGIHWGIASKGSFHSPHAEWATKWMEDHINNWGRLIFPEGYTPVFEIICQEVQPHVIKYPKDELVLLALINNETGEESQQTYTYGPKNNNLLIPVPFFIELDEAIKDDDSTFEGYVVTYNIPNKPPLKLKYKFPTFLENRKQFYAEKSNASLQVKLAQNDKRYAEVFNRCTEIVKEAFVYCTTREEFARYFNKPNNKFYASGCFALLDDDKTNKHRDVIKKLAEK